MWLLRAVLAICLAAAAFAPARAEVEDQKAQSTSILIGEYKLPASIDPSVAADVQTELWAAVYRPARKGRYPLLVFLHGNHGTCGRIDAGLGIRIDDRVDYTFSGTCPEGWQPTPNHLGYGYLASQLAANGYVVVSINANRGVNAGDGVEDDEFLNLRRGRLVLRHLQQLSSWNAGRAPTPASLQFSLRGAINFNTVGLLGHSRGGEGMRAALAQFRDPNSPWPQRIGKINFQALFEIGPVDGQTPRTLDADGVVWNVLLPGCDGDVSELDGLKPFDRMVMRSAERNALPKSTFEVLGANHNFYNTEWQRSDAEDCQGQPKLFPAYGGSEKQRLTAAETVIPFFRAYVGSARRVTLAERFDPSRPLPPALRAVSYFARGHSASLQPASNFIIDDFTRDAGTSSRGAANTAYRLDEYSHGEQRYQHVQRQATVAWSAPDAYLQINAANGFVNLRRNSLRSLEFRVKLECFDSLCSTDTKPDGNVDFSIRLVNGDGSLSAPVRLSSAALLYRPGGALFSSEDSFNNAVFQTVRIPLKSFKGVNITRFRGVRFSFDVTSRGRVSFGNVRLVKALAGSPGLATAPGVRVSGLSAAINRARAGETNEIAAVRPHTGAAKSGGRAASAMMEIELTSTRAFGVTGALPVLHIGGQTFRLSRFVDGRTDRMIFLIGKDDYDRLSSGADVKLVIGGAAVWNFGQLRKP